MAPDYQLAYVLKQDAKSIVKRTIPTKFAVATRLTGDSVAGRFGWELAATEEATEEATGEATGEAVEKHPIRLSDRQSDQHFAA
ncbi:MAG: hypothetical protein KDB14_04560 [Planctomycetales bacterium]|nr:hypothetical protein [Planctomycetales bacterium]